MARSQLKSKRKASGGRFVSARAKKKRELAGYSVPAHGLCLVDILYAENFIKNE